MSDSEFWVPSIVGFVVFFVFLCFVFLFFVFNLVGDLERLKDCERTLAFCNDKEVYEARIELSEKLRKLTTSGFAKTLLRCEVRDLINNSIKYLPDEERLYYKIKLYKGEL